MLVYAVVVECNNELVEIFADKAKAEQFIASGGGRNDGRYDDCVVDEIKVL